MFQKTRITSEYKTSFHGKGHFFSDHSALTNRPDAKMQLLLIFSGFLSAFLKFLPENYSMILE